MGLAEYMTENVSNNGQTWEPDHEPPTDDKPDALDVSCTTTTTDDHDDARTPVALPAPLDDRCQHSPLPPSLSNVPKALAPLNHHNQLTRFMAKQTLGYIPKLSVRSPERSPEHRTTTSPSSTVYGGLPREGGGVFTFDSSHGKGGGSPSFRLPSLTPPLSPQKWTSPALLSTHEDMQTSEEGRSSLPALGQNTSTSTFLQRSGSFSETCASPIPPLKRQYTQETTTHHSVMSIADLCQPFRYMRASSCPSDTNPGVAAGSSPTTPLENTVSPAIEQSWSRAIDPQTYARTQSCSSDVVTQRESRSHRDTSPLNDGFQRHRLERSTSMDAPTLVRHLKRTAAESIDLTQWLDRSGRSSLTSLADSADSMNQLEQAGRSMCISDSPRSDTVGLNEAKREKKLCAFPQCASNAVTRGLCISHGGGRRCQRKGCTRGAQSKGLCVAHGGGRICRATGCSNIQRSMGLCIRHGGGRRCSVKGCQKGVVRQDLCTAHGGKRKCRVADCTKHVKKKGLCRSHANSLYGTSGSS